MEGKRFLKDMGRMCMVALPSGDDECVVRRVR